MVKYYSPQVEPLENGKFKYSIRYTDPSFVGVKKSSTTMTKDTTHSRKLADEVVKKKIKNKLNKIDIKRITVEDLLKKLKANLSEQGLAPKTLNTYFSFFNRFSRQFSTRVVDSISSAELNIYFNDLLYKEKLSNGTVSKYRILVSKIFDYAVQFGYTKSDPTTNVKINYKNERAKKQDRIENWYLTDDELNLFLNDCLARNRKDFYYFFKMMYLTGMRFGECSALLVKNFFQDPDTHIWYVTICGTLIKVSGHEPERQEFTKTASSYRTIALPKEAVEIYKKLSKNQNSDDFLFHNQRNSQNAPISIYSVSRCLRRFIKKKKWKKHISSHIFRHTHISKLAEEGYPLDLIAARVGHRDSEITRQIYLHITEKRHREFDQAIQNFK